MLFLQGHSSSSKSGLASCSILPAWRHCTRGPHRLTIMCFGKRPSCCSYQYNNNNDLLHSLRQESTVVSTATCKAFTWSDGTQNLCIIDPFMNVTLDPSIKEDLSTADTHFYVWYAVHSTRIVMWPSMNLTEAHVFRHLVFRKCTVY